MRRAVQKIEITSVTKRTILNPHWFQSIISFLHKDVYYGYRVDGWVPFPMTCRMVSRNNYGPTSNGKPLAA